MAKKKYKLKIEKQTIISFVLIFAIATAVFVPVRTAAANFANKTIFNGQTGDPADIDGDGEPDYQAEVLSLMKDMKPIAVDEGSAFYDVFQSKDRINILCLGVNDGMTDTIMVVSYDMANQIINLISVPRDTYHYRGPGFADYANHKINCVYRAYGGGQQGAVKLAEAVSEVLYGMPLHYYVTVDYEVVREVMAAVGGVHVNIPFHMKYIDDTPGYELLKIDIPAGDQIIDETNVIEFLRFRHTNPMYAAQGYKSYEDGDVQRIKVQQEFVITVMKKVIKDGSVIDVAKTALNSKNIQSDLTYGVASKMASAALKGLDVSGITAYSLPGTSDYIQELSFWVPSDKGIADMLREVYSLEAPEDDAATGAAITTPAAAQ